LVGKNLLIQFKELLMIVNPKIKEMYKEIAKESIKHQNTRDSDRKYHKRILSVYKTHLTEEEQLYVLVSVLETIHYKNIVTDPDNVLTLHTIRMRNVTYIFLAMMLLIFLAAALFKTNEAMNGLMDMLGNGFKLLSL
jgi:hypothetical protein